MAKWNMVCEEFKEIREMMYNGEKTLDVANALINICMKYGNMSWDFAESFNDLSDDINNAIEDGEFDNEDEEDNYDNFNYYLNDFYDLCDIARIWLQL